MTIKPLMVLSINLKVGIQIKIVLILRPLRLNLKQVQRLFRKPQFFMENI